MHTGKNGYSRENLKSGKIDRMTHPALLIQEVKHAQLSLYEIDALLIITELNPAPGQLLADVLLLLQVEHMLQTPQNKTAKSENETKLKRHSDSTERN